MTNRQQRLERVGSHTDAITDTVLSGILQGTREAIGALLEGKNHGLNWLAKKLSVTPKKSWYGKTRRVINNELLGRIIKAANGVVDTAGTAVITSIDVINNTQGSIHDIFTGDTTSKGMIAPLLSGAFNDVLWRKAIRQTIIDGVILNKTIDTHFDPSSGRTYGESATKPLLKKTPISIPSPRSTKKPVRKRPTVIKP